MCTSRRKSHKVTDMEKNTSSYIRKENKNFDSYFGDAEKCFKENVGEGAWAGVKIGSGKVKVNINSFYTKIFLKQCAYPRKENSKFGLIESVHDELWTVQH